MIRLVATDLDGTLWGPDMVVPAAHLEAIDELTRRGVTVLAATSRRPRVARAGLALAGVTMPGVLLDGAVGIDFGTGQVFHQALFDPPAAVMALGVFRGCDLDPCVYVDDPGIDVVTSASPSTCSAHLAHLGDYAQAEDLDVAVSSRAVYGFSLMGLDRERLSAVAILLQANDATQVVIYREATYGGYGLMVGPAGVSKWTGIEAYCRRAGITANEVLAVGDGDNDLTMLCQAGIAVGVRGGSDAVGAYADHLIGPPGAHGWAEVPDLIA